MIQQCIFTGRFCPGQGEGEVPAPPRTSMLLLHRFCYIKHSNTNQTKSAALVKRVNRGNLPDSPPRFAAI